MSAVSSHALANELIILTPFPNFLPPSTLLYIHLAHLANPTCHIKSSQCRSHGSP